MKICQVNVGVNLRIFGLKVGLWIRLGSGLAKNRVELVRIRDSLWNVAF